MKVSAEVLKVLGNSTIKGTELTLPSHLDRPMYVAVNKVLEAAGWKWNKKAKAHTCEGDAEDTLEQVLLTGEVTMVRNEFGFFPTPHEIVKQLLDLADIKPDMAVLEPSAGNGAIAFQIAKKTSDLYCVELLQANYEILCSAINPKLVAQANFLNLVPLPLYDRVVMNPPFAKQADIKHVTHALKFLRPGGKLVAVMSNGITFRSDRRTEEFLELLNAHQGVKIDLPAGSFKKSGTMVNTIIVTMVK